ncbi:MAG: UDP-N-acetylmuramate dehydrogenase [Pseudomonadota bacterium]
MSAELMETLRRQLGDRARFNEPLAGHTTWGIGGPAWCFCRVQSAAEAVAVAGAARVAGMAVKALGRGSNLLVGDRGFAGVVLSLAGELATSRVDGATIAAGGGAALPSLVRLAAEQGLAGLEWAAGIPASLGGAIANNAGASGGQMSELIETVELLLADGALQTLAGHDLGGGYRRGGLPAGAVVLGARLRLTFDDQAAVAARTRAILARRKATQPLGAATAGSVFKNPPGDHAGRLIEAAGCKGWRQGGAMVSERHANFIENAGKASAADVLALMERVRARVRAACGVELEAEVEVVGDV